MAWMDHYVREDGVSFKVGDVVQGWSTGHDHRGGFLYEGRINYLDGPNQFIINLTLTKGEVVYARAIWGDTAILVKPKLDPAQPMRCRDPNYKIDLDGVGTGDRPIAATVRTPAGLKLHLTYPVTGEFYPGFEQPIDLVQA